jgi:hypothetical protein
MRIENQGQCGGRGVSHDGYGAGWLRFAFCLNAGPFQRAIATPSSART